MAVKIECGDVYWVKVTESKTKRSYGEKTKVNMFTQWLFDNSITPMYLSVVGGGVFEGYFFIEDKQAVDMYLDRMSLRKEDESE